MKELLNFNECRKLFQPILDFDNKLKEGTENFNELLKRYK